MNPSNEHNNWITVGEVINLVKKPVASYTSQVVQKWHSTKLFGICTSAANCKTQKDPTKLCRCCKQWYDELRKSHRKPGKSEWRKNCDPSMWSTDWWEAAKFFMSILGDNKSTVRDAKSTDLGSLLNVLEWTKDPVFAPDRRVDRNCVVNLRSKVRNLWAHAPNQEMTQSDRDQAFKIATDFVTDLDKVFPFAEVKNCMQDVKNIETNGLTNVAESELRVLKLLANEIGADMEKLKEDIKCLKQEQDSDHHGIKENERKLSNLENRMEECLTKMESLFLVSQKDINCPLKSYIPDQPRTFIGRDEQVEKIISSLVYKECGIVSIVGGPGFGKSTIAVKVSHRLKDEYDIVIIFSFLSHVFTVPEVIRCLCLDVGVEPGDDPKSSLMFWVKSTCIKEKVVLVMDNIEQLLEDEVRHEFVKLMATLRKDSNQKLQILTTTRTKFTVSHQAVENVNIRELDEKSSVELLKTYGCNENVTVLSTLANLCGHVPLALCIAGSRILDFDDLEEMIQCLQDTPMETLDNPENPDQSVRRTIEFSFHMLDDEDKKALVRLSVFAGNFQRKSAQEVIERDGLKTLNLLKMLEVRSLIQSSVDRRFVIHSLIRRFLADHEKFQDEKLTAQRLMVKHFLKMCHSLTIDSFSKDGFTDARKSLKNDVHNVEEILNICSQDQPTNLDPIISETLTCSDIYKSSSRFFYNFCWDLLPQPVLRNFHKSCATLAESRNERAIEIVFHCLSADQEGRKCNWKSDDFFKRMENIKRAFDENRSVLRNDRTLFLYCYYFCARNNKKGGNTENSDLPESDLPEEFRAHLPESNERSYIEKVEEDILISIQRGHLYKKHANNVFKKDKENYEKFMKLAERYYKEALLSANELLGNHESTCICYKLLGDVNLNRRKNEAALRYYDEAITLRKKLRLDSNEPFVFLLKNYGFCLHYHGRFEESVEKLHEACKIADLLAEKSTPCRAKVYCALARTYHKWKPHCSEAAKFGEEAMAMQALLDERDIKCLKDILTVQKNITEENTLLL